MESGFQKNGSTVRDGRRDEEPVTDLEGHSSQRGFRLSKVGSSCSGHTWGPEQEEKGGRRSDSATGGMRVGSYGGAGIA